MESQGWEDRQGIGSERAGAGYRSKKWGVSKNTGNGGKIKAKLVSESSR